MKERRSIKKLVLAALFAALVFVATALLHFHIPGVTTGAYVHLGDCLVIIAGILLGPVYGSAAACIGSALADYNHALYIPATFVIKFLMAFVSHYIYRFLAKDKNDYKAFPVIASAVVSEAIMMVGYFAYEWFVTVGLPGAVLGVPGNIIQAVAGCVFSFLLLKILKKSRVTDMISLG